MMALDEYRKANLANWDERVAGHIAPDGYDIESLVNDPTNVSGVVRFDQDALGDVAGKTLLHSQCHIGTDTLSWAKLGATVTGIDFSPAAISAARDIAALMAIDATFVETEFYDAPQRISEQFDIVYTSVGAICWLPDIDRWGEIVAGFVKPGGTFYIRDGHPMLMTLDDKRTDQEMVVTYNYFYTPEPLSFPEEESYLGSAKLENSESYEWPHTLADVINALIGAGLRIDRVEELQHLDWEFMPWMESDGETYVLPESHRNKMPLQFSIRATKPTAS
jgi:SAM-dependent methyltransferase